MSNFHCSRSTATKNLRFGALHNPLNEGIGILLLEFWYGAPPKKKLVLGRGHPELLLVNTFRRLSWGLRCLWFYGCVGSDGVEGLVFLEVSKSKWPRGFPEALGKL